MRQDLLSRARQFAIVLALAGTGMAQAAPDMDVPAAIALPAGAKVVLQLSATGVQIYRCEAAAGDANAFAWKFKAPEATLADAQGHPAGRHYAGPTWESADGSRITATVAAKQAAPDGNSIPWLLLTAVVAQPGGALGHVAYVQRLHTQGGSAPATGCSADKANAEIRVPYTADYWFSSKD